MRELYYAIFHAASTEVLIDVVLAEAVLNKAATITKKGVSLIAKNKLAEPERQLLECIELGATSRISYQRLAAFKEHMCVMCKAERYILWLPFIGYFRTIRFKNEIRQSLEQNIFNKHLREYLETNNRLCLQPIIPRIAQI